MRNLLAILLILGLTFSMIVLLFLINENEFFSIGAKFFIATPSILLSVAGIIFLTRLNSWYRSKTLTKLIEENQKRKEGLHKQYIIFQQASEDFAIATIKDYRDTKRIDKLQLYSDELKQHSKSWSMTLSSGSGVNIREIIDNFNNEKNDEKI